jgi:hypothetical protein
MNYEPTWKCKTETSQGKGKKEDRWSSFESVRSHLSIDKDLLVFVKRGKRLLQRIDPLAPDNKQTTSRQDTNAKDLGAEADFEPFFLQQG